MHAVIHKFFFVGVLFFAGLQGALAQPANDNCANAIALCPNFSLPASTQGATTEVGPGLADGAMATGTFCFDVDNTIWFTFTTNDVGGSADVNISNINCINTPGNDTELSASLLSAGTPCDATTYTLLGNCEMGSANNITLTEPALAPNTTYYVVIDGDLNGMGITVPSACDFSVGVSGPAVDWTINTTVVDQTCGNMDGSITINSVGGGTGPYMYAINGGAFQAGTTFSNLNSMLYHVTVQDANGCIQSIPQQVFVPLSGGVTGAIPMVTDAGCNMTNGSVDITAVMGGTPPYLYAIGAGAPQMSSTFNGLAAGTYQFTVFDATGCPFVIDGVNVNVAGGLSDVNVTVTPANCGQNDGVVSADMGTGGTAPLSYMLNAIGPQAAGEFQGLAPGAYTLVVTDANLCTFTSNVVVSELTASVIPEISISVTPNPVCQGDNVIVQATLTNAGTGSIVEFLVDGVVVQTGAQTSFMSTTLVPGNVVSATLTSPDLCLLVNPVSSNTIPITILPTANPSIAVSSTSTTICADETVTFIAAPNDCQGDANFDWMVNGAVVSSGTNTTFTGAGLADGDEVTVTMSCSYACSMPPQVTSTPITVNVTDPMADAGFDQSILQGNSASLSGSGNGMFSWSPQTTLSNPNSQNPVATPSETVTYTLTVTDGNCVDMDEVTITVLPIIDPPNTITPNNDGFNDTWEIPGIDRFPNVVVSIYDRWGQRVFKSNGYASPWDGTNRGLRLPVAAYYYVIEFDQIDAGAGQINGTISIIR